MISVFYLALLLLMLLYPELYIPSAYHALKIWGLDVVPSLFPYMVFCRLLAARLRVTRIHPSCISVFLGLLGGSPSGASVLCAYSQAMPTQVLLPLAALTGTLSPMFILNTAYKWLRNSALCSALFVCHLAGAVFSAVLVCWLMRRFPACFQLSHTPNADTGSGESIVQQSILAVLNIGGCIVMYSVMAVYISKLPLLSSSQFLSAFAHALLEISGGMHAISALPDTPMRAYLLAAAAGFSGLSILAQNAYFLRPLGIRMKHQLLFSLLRAVGSVLAMGIYQTMA